MSSVLGPWAPMTSCWAMSAVREGPVTKESARGWEAFAMTAASSRERWRVEVSRMTILFSGMKLSAMGMDGEDPTKSVPVSAAAEKAQESPQTELM